MYTIVVEELKKYYGKTCGVDNLSFTVEAGSVFGFLGPNGSGKTTTIRLLLDIIRPDSGNIHLFGSQVSPTYPSHLRKRIGYLPGELRLYEEMTGLGYLELIGSFYGKVSSNYFSYLCDSLLISRKDLARKLEGFSRGMKQKIGIIQALQHDPELIILDEPTEGLDPLIRNRFYKLIEEAKDKGRTIFFSSHNLAEVEKVCEKVAILRDGTLLTTTTVEELKKMRLYKINVEFTTEDDAEGFALEDVTVEGTGRSRTIHWRGDFDELFKALIERKLVDFTCTKADLEEIFLTFYQKDGESK